MERVFKILNSHILHVVLGGCFFLSACNSKTPYIRAVINAENYIYTAPEISKNILDSLENPLGLNEEYFAKYIFLSCKLADHYNKHLPLHSDIQTACEWYKRKGNKSDLAQMYLNLGRSYIMNEEYKKGMAEYLNALEVAEINHLHDYVGYVYSYMGDFYTDTNDLFAACDKYEKASKCFIQVNNMRSYAFSLRDIGRTWALVDSLDKSFTYFLLADSIADSLNDLFVKSTILNGLGNLYALNGDYERAENALLLALDLDTIVQTSSLNALTDIYINQNNYSRAKKILDSVSSIDLTGEHKYVLNYKHYQLNKKQNKIPEALSFLENVFDLFQTELVDNSQESFHELEKKYTQAKNLNYIQRLKISIQFYLFFLIIAIVLVLLLIIVFLKRKINYSKRISELDKEISNLMTQCYVLTRKVDESKIQKDRESDRNEEKRDESILQLNQKLNASRHTRLLISDIGKKLNSTSQKVTPSSEGKNKITAKIWEAIEKEVKIVYPEFETKIYELCPDISDADWLYCCFVLFNFDTKAEATILDINPHSVRQKRSRIKKKLGLSHDSISLYESFVKSLFIC